MSDETLVLLARHGATQHNLAVPIRLQGNAINGPLAEVGIEQARALATTLSPLPVRAIYCSQMVRARQTAEIVATPFSLHPVALDGLHEISVGEG